MFLILNYIIKNLDGKDEEILNSQKFEQERQNFEKEINQEKELQNVLRQQITESESLCASLKGFYFISKLSRNE